MKSTCTWPGCDRVEYARGLCARDYKRAAALNEWDTPWDGWAERTSRKRQAHQAECRWPDCTRVHSSQGLCTMHYSRARTAGDYDKPWETWEAWKPRKGQESWKGQYTECRWPDCGDEISGGRGLCAMHYQRARNLNEWDTPWDVWAPWPHNNECGWPECSNRGDVRGFCSKHYGRARDVNDFETPWVSWNEHTDCDFCGETTGSRSVRYCSGSCAAMKWRTENPEEWRAIKRMAGNRRHARKLATTTDHFTETDVIERYGSNCYLCARPVDFSVLYPDPDSPSLDHIIPLSKGGTHTLENCAMTHLLCNNKKQATVSDLRPTLLVK